MTTKISLRRCNQKQVRHSEVNRMCVVFFIASFSFRSAGVEVPALVDSAHVRLLMRLVCTNYNAFIPIPVLRIPMLCAGST
jgi:hypothetical protein